MVGNEASRASKGGIDVDLFDTTGRRKGSESDVRKGSLKLRMSALEIFTNLFTTTRINQAEPVTQFPTLINIIAELRIVLMDVQRKEAGIDRGLGI